MQAIREYIKIRGGIEHLAEEEKQAIINIFEEEKNLMRGSISLDLADKLLKHQRTNDRVLKKEDISELMVFSAKYVKSPKIPVYRGLRQIKATPSSLFAGRSIGLRKSPYESWSYSWESARDFAGTFGSLGMGFVLKKNKVKPGTLVWDFVSAKKAKILGVKHSHFDDFEEELILLPQCKSCSIKDVAYIYCEEDCEELLRDTVAAALGNRWTIKYGRRIITPKTSDEDVEAILEDIIDAMDIGSGNGFLGRLDHGKRIVNLEDV